MDQLEVLIPITLFLSITVILVLRGPFGRALAERLSRRGDDREVLDLKADVAELRHELADMQERLDFAERLLARQQDKALPGAR